MTAKSIPGEPVIDESGTEWETSVPVDEATVTVVFEGTRALSSDLWQLIDKWASANDEVDYSTFPMFEIIPFVRVEGLAGGVVPDHDKSFYVTDLDEDAHTAISRAYWKEADLLRATSFDEN